MKSVSVAMKITLVAMITLLYVLLLFDLVKKYRHHFRWIVYNFFTPFDAHRGLRSDGCSVKEM